MNERDRQNPYDRSQQHAGGSRGDQGYDSPRQQNQWQDEGNRQAGGDWQQNAGSRGYDDYTRDYRFSGGANAGSDRDYRSQLSDDDMRRDQRDAARNYNSSRGDYSRGDYDRSRGDFGSDRNRDEWRGGSGQRPYEGGYGQRDYDASGGSRFSNFTSEDFGGGRPGGDFYARGGGSAGVSGGMHPSNTYRPSYGLSHWLDRDNDDRSDRSDRGGRDYGDWRRYGESRGFLAKAGDEIASWFGDEDAFRRREQDRGDNQSGQFGRDNHSGRGPSNYTRSDDRIREDANDALTHDWAVDATHITVSVNNGEVTLDGTVDSRQAKRRAEDAVDRVSGVKHVQNNLRVQERQSNSGNWSGSSGGTGSSFSSGGGSSGITGSNTTGSSGSGATNAAVSSTSGNAAAGSGSSGTGANTTSGIGSAATAGVGTASTTRANEKSS